MKKKLLLFAAMLIVMASMLAINVFAQDDVGTGTELRTSVTYNGQSYPINRYEYEFSSLASVLNNGSLTSDMEAILDENSVVILKDTDGNLSAYPSYYVIELSGQADDDYGEYIAISEMNYSFVNSVSGKNYEKGAVVYMEFPEGMTRVRNNGVFGRKNADGYEINVTDVVIPTTVVRMERAFYANPSLQKVTIKNGSLLQNIGENAFCDCTALTDIELSHLTNLVSIDEYAFQRCTLLPTLAMPDTVQSIGFKAFDGCTNLTFASSYLPSSLTSIGEYFCSGVKKLNNVLIFPEGITIIPQEAFGNATTADGGTLNLVFLGEMSGNTMLNGNDYRTWAEQVIIYFAKNSLSDYSATLYSVGTDGSLTQGQSQTGSFWIKPSNGALTNTTKIPEKALMLVFCENSTPEISYMLSNAGTAITEATTYSNNGDITADIISHTQNSKTHIFTTENKDCSGTGICIICECANQIEHTNGGISSIVYKSGFLSRGDINYNCSVCKGTYLKENIANPLYTCFGYSLPKDGSGGITVGFTVDNGAVAEYKKYIEATGDTFRYGVFAVLQDRLKTNDIFEKDGTSAAGVIYADISSYGYITFELRIIGFTDKQKDTKIAMGAYVAITDNETNTTEYSYMQSGTPNENEKYCFVSYNDVVNLKSTTDDGASE